MRRSPIERVLVAIKPWQRGLPLESQHASQLADALGGELMLVSSVFDARVAARANRADTTALAARKRLIEAEHVELDRLAQSLRDWDTTVTTRVVWEAPAYQAVLHVAEEWQADLLVIGVHERRFRLGTRLTDTDWQLMRLTPCPLLLVKDPAFDGYPTILAAIDPAHPQAAASGVDRAVLGLSRAIARACGSKLHAVHALPPALPVPSPTVETEPGVFVDEDAIEALERRAVAELAADYELAPDNVDVVQGAPASVIADAAADRNAALVVMGALRRSQVEQAMIGSTAEGVAMEVPCDVLLVPPPKSSPAANLKRTTRAKDTARTAKPRRRGASSAARGRRPAAP
jgi:universal stress protein E